MIRKHLIRFRNDERGAIAVLFAFLFVLILGFAGVAIDYSRSSSVKQQLQDAADATTLAIVKRAADSVASGKTVDEARSEALAFGQQLWTQNINTAGGAAPVTNFTLQPTADTWTATVDYSVNGARTLSRVLGTDDMKIHGTSIASAGGSIKYADFYLLLDGSQSMGLAATQAGTDEMLTNVGCQFACHVPGYESYYDYAHTNKIPLRIDVLRDATNNLIDTAIAQASQPDQFKMGLWSFAEDIAQLAPITTDLASLHSVTNLLDLPTYEDGTRTDEVVSKLNDQLTDSGTGKTPDDPIKFVFIVTDGVQDGIYQAWTAPTTGASTGPISPSACDALKAKGITVAVLYTEYLWFNSWQWPTFVEAFAPQIQPNLEACASPGFFFLATDSAEINTSLQSMFTKALAAAGNLRITR